MSQGLPYFKFYPDQWLAGNITLENNDVQAAFINICCIYWAKSCRVAIATLKQRHSLTMARLLDSHIINDNQGFAQIKFLDEQWKELNQKHNKNSLNGKKGAIARWGEKEAKTTTDNQPVNSEATENDSIKIRKDKIRKDNIIFKEEKKSAIVKNEKPEIGQVRTFFYENGHEADFGEWADGFMKLNEEKYGWLGLSKQTWQEMALSFKLVETNSKPEEESTNQYRKYTGQDE